MAESYPGGEQCPQLLIGPGHKDGDWPNRKRRRSVYGGKARRHGCTFLLCSLGPKHREATGVTAEIADGALYVQV